MTGIQVQKNQLVRISKVIKKKQVPGGYRLCNVVSTEEKLKNIGRS